MTSRQARRLRALIWSISVVVITVITTATVYLLAPAAYRLALSAPADSWWQPALKWLPRYLLPPYSAADLPPVALTVLAAVTLLAVTTRRLTPTLHRRLTPEPAEPPDSEPCPPDEGSPSTRGPHLSRLGTWASVLGLLLAAGGLAYTSRSTGPSTPRDRPGTDTYTEAVSQLASSKLEVRLNAIHTLRRLAQQSPHDRVTTADLMAAYVRRHESTFKAPPSARPATDVQMALNVLGSVYDTPSTEPGHDWVCACNLARIRVPGADLTGLNLDTAVLTRADLHGARLTGADLTYADLSGADLSRAHLGNADLPNAVLFTANLREANLTAADLSGVDLFEADLRGASLSWANLSGVDLFNADLRGADASHANLSGANLSGADLRKARLIGATLHSADLTGTNLKGADLTSADLTDADLRGVDLSQTTLDPTALSRAKTNESTKLPAEAPTP
ncbi:pentapeptide repeat-containing protein [Actinomadura sp. ATCC 31491]|uniref:Pentapeptide repeat-containing protein n=1 Tax=Actinomadura luzonensis TaxID=2805427 RepID=A0ABT0G1L7_9ACTN|nr:pentapeptide repeat-containing protein [Actinomadura luzonensis]MCK2217996.1 pentapeptide repeat-containing protein [Actinomadura luzonensis]